MDRVDERTYRYARNLAARLPEPNRQTAQRYLVLKKNAGLAVGTIHNQAQAIYNLGEQLGSKPFAEVDQDDLMALVERLRRVVTDNTVAQIRDLLPTP